MGADIHMFMQMKRTKEDKWKLHPGHTVDKYGYINNLSGGDRWYTLFGYIAEVRREGPMVCNLGFPEHTPQEIREMCDHTPGWATLEQLEEALELAYNEEDDTLQEQLDADDDISLFYNYRDFRANNPAYPSMIRYARKWIFDTKVDNEFTGVKTDLNNPQIRFIFFFDS